MNSDPSKNSFAADTLHAVKGFCMGVCDAVPGVSGGTVALVAGIYDRLFTAISHFDRKLLTFLVRRQFTRAAAHVDARFLLALVLGLGLGYVAMSVAIKVLMASETLRSLTLASFSGMILGSIWLVMQRIRPEPADQRIQCLGWGLAGCALSSLIAFQNSTTASGEISLLYLFCCTIIAICAMILPGISGAMLLLILGVYYHVVEIPRNLIHLEQVGDNLTRMAVVLAGCSVGLLTFSRLVKWLLKVYREQTLSAMLGLMIGSLLILWPFQHRIEPEVDHHKPRYEAFVPDFSGWVVVVIACVLLFAGLVIAMDRLANSVSQQAN